jgi:glycosyltransferase involved in cell wall biosynthesis
VHIERCLSTTLDKNALPQRMANMLSLATSLSVRALQRIQRGDVVIVGTNPPLLPWATLVVCRARGARCIIRVDDIYPDAAIAAGLIGATSLPARAFDSIEERLFRGSDGIVTMGRCMKSKLERKFPRVTTPIVVIPNYADVEEVSPKNGERNSLRQQECLEDKFVVLVAGNLGRVQGLEILIGAAKELLTEPDVHFLVVGDGARLNWLHTEKARLGLTNLTLTGARPRSEQNTFLKAGDVALLTLTKGMVGVGVPSRLYNYLAAGMPVISATGEGSETSLVVQEENVGWSVEPLDSAQLAAAVRDARNKRAELAEMGSRARRVAEQRFSRNSIVVAYQDAIDRVLEGTSIAG